MRIQDVYRLALARGLTAKQAGGEYKVNHQSLAKCKGRYNLPSLISEAEKAVRETLTKMYDKDLTSYIKVLEQHKFQKNKEYKYATDEQALRAKRNK